MRAMVSFLPLELEGDGEESGDDLEQAVNRRERNKQEITERTERGGEPIREICSQT